MSFSVNRNLHDLVVASPPRRLDVTAAARWRYVLGVTTIEEFEVEVEQALLQEQRPPFPAPLMETVSR